jgi:two-component system, LuxR family, response regulator FixJ
MMDLPPNTLISIVDDNELSLTTLSSALRTFACEVHTFSTPEEFLENLDCERPGCIILDYRMPTMSGLEVVRSVRLRGCCTPFVVVTGYGNVAIAVQFMKLGAVTVLEKPFDFEQLISALQFAIEFDINQRKTMHQRAIVTAKRERLTAREDEILSYVLCGMPSKQIASKLGISPKTVEVHRSNIIKKMEVESINQLIQLTLSQPQAELGIAAEAEVDSRPQL